MGRYLNLRATMLSMHLHRRHFRTTEQAGLRQNQFGFVAGGPVFISQSL